MSVRYRILTWSIELISDGRARPGYVIDNDIDGVLTSDSLYATWNISMSVCWWNVLKLNKYQLLLLVDRTATRNMGERGRKREGEGGTYYRNLTEWLTSWLSVDAGCDSGWRREATSGDQGQTWWTRIVWWRVATPTRCHSSASDTSSVKSHVLTITLLLVFQTQPWA